MLKETDKDYAAFCELVEKATKEQLIQYIYEIVPQMYSEQTWKEIRVLLDELRDTLNSMSQLKHAAELLKECGNQWDNYDDKLFKYKNNLIIQKIHEEYRAMGEKKGTGLSIFNYASQKFEQKITGISNDMIKEGGREKETFPTEPAIFYETIEEALKDAESAQQGFMCVRIKDLRQLLKDLVLDMEKNGRNERAIQKIRVYNIRARKADHKGEGKKITFYTFPYSYEEMRKKGYEKVEHIQESRSRALRQKKEIESC